MDILAQYFLKLTGSVSAHKTVIFGSGAGPKLVKLCKYLKEFLVTSGFPLLETPPIASVTQVGSPANNSSYSGERK